MIDRADSFRDIRPPGFQSGWIVYRSAVMIAVAWIHVSAPWIHISATAHGQELGVGLLAPSNSQEQDPISPREWIDPCDGWCEDQTRHHNTGFIDFNTYWDTRDFAVTTFNLGAKLPHDFEYFQLLNLYGPFGSGSFDWTDYFTEVNLRRPVWKDNAYWKHLDWTAQYADGSGPQGTLRLGIKWRFQNTQGPIGHFFEDVLKLKYSVNFHLLETDGTGWQMEHVYRRTFFDKRIYIAGFVDHNINNGGRNSAWVTEHQVGLRLFDQWHAIAEYRYSSFAPSQYKSGWGFGLEYVIRFN